MPVIDLKQFSQPYVGSRAEMQDFLNPVRTTAQLAAQADEINVKDKFAGRMVWDSTLGQPVWADGPDDDDTWSLATGVIAHAPS